MENNMSMVFDAKSENEGLARMVISAFITELDPTIEELNDVMHTVVPLCNFDSTYKSSINISININPIPERSSSGLVVKSGSLAFSTFSMPTP